MTRVSLRRDFRLLPAVFIPPLIILLGMAAIAVVRDLDTGAIFRDPASVIGYHPLVGFMSWMGIILWWLAAGICFFTLALSRALALGRPIQVFLLTSGLLSLLLAIDDHFLFHEDLAAEYLGLRKRHVIVAYMLFAGGWLLLNRSIIRRSRWSILAVSLLLFATAIAADFVVQTSVADTAEIGLGLDWGLFVEDGLKFLGIVGWATYLVLMCYLAITTRDPPLEARTTDA
jgi:hypothetical protein